MVKTQQGQDNPNQSKGERIAKVMARAGLCSRREAERWIEEGRVELNGQLLQTPACLVTGDDKIIIDGKALPQKEKTRLFLYHKPAGLITTSKDEKGRPTIFEEMPEDFPRIVAVGRLDMNTEGLLLLTNDGELSRYLELPKNNIDRTYRVRAHGKISQNKLDSLKNGLTYQGLKYQPMTAELEKEQGTNVWIKIILQEGKNREVRNVMESLGLQVNRLIRISYGPFHLGKLEKGAILEVRSHQMKTSLPGFFT